MFGLRLRKKKTKKKRRTKQVSKYTHGLIRRRQVKDKIVGLEEFREKGKPAHYVLVKIKGDKVLLARHFKNKKTALKYYNNVLKWLRH